MDQYNAIINCRTRNLGLDAETVTARKGHSIRVAVKSAPDDVTALFVRVFKPNGAYFDFPANMRPSGVWTCQIIGTAFPDEGEARYEVHATDSAGNPTAIATGALHVLPFSVTSTPIAPGATVTVAQIPAADGSMVQIQMVQDEVGQWVYRAL